MRDPFDCINTTPPNVWVTNFFGFSPETWGLLGFSSEQQRRHFIKKTDPGALVVVYGHKKKAPISQRGMVIGIQQVSHIVNSANAFIDPSAWVQKEANPDSAGRWAFALKATRAWKIAQEGYVPIEEFASETYTRGRAQTIGSLGMRLQQSEALKILSLPLVETSVFGEIPIDAAVPTLGSQLFAPSRAGPVSQSGYFCREAEGPKSLYILQLKGDASAFLGRSVDDMQIVKIGMSGNPDSRCEAFNKALPNGAFKWELVRSNTRDLLPLFPNSKLAIDEENKLKTVLHRSSTSLGGEFFLATEFCLTKAWNAAMEVLSR